MGENRSHMEPLEKRIMRFQNGHPTEIISTLLNSIQSFFNNEIQLTTKSDHYQTSLMFLGVHAVALTISEGFYDKTGVEGYKLFLKKFIDGQAHDTKFSEIATEIHGWRNILAHQWLGISGYGIGYDYKMKSGWEKRGDVIFVNPRIYVGQYLDAFGIDGRIWDYQEMFSEDEMHVIKYRFLEKFLSQ